MVRAGRFLEAFLGLIVLPLVLVAITEALARRVSPRSCASAGVRLAHLWLTSHVAVVVLVMILCGGFIGRRGFVADARSDVLPPVIGSFCAVIFYVIHCSARFQRDCGDGWLRHCWDHHQRGWFNSAPGAFSHRGNEGGESPAIQSSPRGPASAISIMSRPLSAHGATSAQHGPRGSLWR